MGGSRLIWLWKKREGEESRSSGGPKTEMRQLSKVLEPKRPNNPNSIDHPKHKMLTKIKVTGVKDYD